MQGPAVVFGAIATVIIGLDIWATVVVARQTDLPLVQRHFQIMFVWLLPVIGAMMAMEIHRRAKQHKPRARLAADEISPILDQALRPLADAATRTSERYIEKELTDFGHDASHSDGPH